MSLIACTECRREISSSAEACPHCGYPLKKADVSGPKCYHCSEPATTLCQGGCGRMSCVKHLKHIVVANLKFAVNELRCEECYAKAVENNELTNGCGCIIVSLLVCAMGFFAWKIWATEQEGRRDQEIFRKSLEQKPHRFP
jgi:hypothetical protein